MTEAVLCPAFNRCVIEMAQRYCPDYQITDDESLCDSLDKIKEYYAKTGRILVWTGASDNTIFGAPSVNWAFRAWHDFIHVCFDLPFTKEGELQALEIHKTQVRYFHSTREAAIICDMLDCEIAGQLEYKDYAGEFPPNQYEFATKWLERRRYESPSTI